MTKLQTVGGNFFWDTVHISQLIIKFYSKFPPITRKKTEQITANRKLKR